MKTSRVPRLRRALLAVVSTAVAGVVGLSAAGCVQREDSARAEVADRVPVESLHDVVLHIGDQKGGTEALLRASGQLDDTPYRIEFSTFTSGPPQIEAATAGQIDAAITGNTPPVFGAASKARISLVAAYANAGGGDRILVHEDSPVRSPADLRGRKIAVGKGTSAHGHLLLQLLRAGLSPSDVSIVFLQPAEASAAFDRGDVDAWAIWDPYTAIAETENRARSIATAEGVSNGYWFAIASHQALSDPRRSSALADFLVRMARAGSWSTDHRPQWAASYQKAVGISEQAATLSQSRSTRSPVALTPTVPREQKLADAFSDSGIIGRVDIASYIDDRYASDLAPVVRPEP